MLLSKGTSKQRSRFVCWKKRYARVQCAGSLLIWNLFSTVVLSDKGGTLLANKSGRMSYDIICPLESGVYSSVDMLLGAKETYNTAWPWKKLESAEPQFCNEGVWRWRLQLSTSLERTLEVAAIIQTSNELTRMTKLVERAHPFSVFVLHELRLNLNLAY